MEKKIALEVEKLCSGLPPEFAEYMSYVKSLSQGQRPDYRKLQRMFRGLARREGIKYDNVFDWTERVYLQQERERNSS